MKVVFEEYFNKSEGQPFIYNNREVKMSDKISMPSNTLRLKITFISTNSEWKQGIVMKTKGLFEFVVDGENIPNGIVLWEDTAPKEVGLVIKSKSKILFIYNVWDTGDGTMHYGHNGGALFVEQTNGISIYHCNDGHPDDDFNDLVFKVEYY